MSYWTYKKEGVSSIC